MKPRPSDLPEFRKPPIVETVLSLQFEAIPGFTSAHTGLLWNRVREDFPLVEEHIALPSALEKFDPRPFAPFEITFEEKPPSPRMWFLNEEKSELIQVQSDRFIHNWRKTEEVNPYPRYEPIRDKFRQEVNAFEAFLRDESLSTPIVNQCEVTYVNHIEPDGVWAQTGQLEEILSVWSKVPGGSFLPAPEDANLRIRFVIRGATGQPVGRLHAVLQPGLKAVDSSPMIVLTLTARGTPIGEGLEGAFEFLDLGREWIVKGFTNLTTPQMHRAWGRIDV